MQTKNMALSKQEDTQQMIIALQKNLRDMPTDMKRFSEAMRALYSDQAVGGSSEVSTKFRELRDNTRNDAVVYLKGVLPVSTKFVASISDYFEYYECLNYDEWCENVSDILQEATAYRQLAETIVKMHQDMLVPLKKREDEAKLIIQEFEGLQKEFDRNTEKLKRMAITKRSCAIGFAAVPYVGAIATPILAVSAEFDLAEASAKKEEGEVHGKAAITVSQTLIPALKNFISGLEAAAGFFVTMEQELGKFEGKAEKGRKEQKQLHYKVMKREAEKIDTLCKSFFAVLPAVRTNFEAIPSTGTDKSYVDKWLEKQKQAIRNKVKLRSLVENIMKAITEK